VCNSTDWMTLWGDNKVSQLSSPQDHREHETKSEEITTLKIQTYKRLAYMFETYCTRRFWCANDSGLKETDRALIGLIETLETPVTSAYNNNTKTIEQETAIIVCFTRAVELELKFQAPVSGPASKNHGTVSRTTIYTSLKMKEEPQWNMRLVKD